MEFHLKLAENETKEDVNALSVTNALYKFVKQHNEFNKGYHDFDKVISMRDIADIIQIMCISSKEFFKALYEKEENANT